MGPPGRLGCARPNLTVGRVRAGAGPSAGRSRSGPSRRADEEGITRLNSLFSLLGSRFPLLSFFSLLSSRDRTRAFGVAGGCLLHDSPPDSPLALHSLSTRPPLALLSLSTRSPLALLSPLLSHSLLILSRSPSCFALSVSSGGSRSRTAARCDPGSTRTARPGPATRQPLRRARRARGRAGAGGAARGLRWRGGGRRTSLSLSRLLHHLSYISPHSSRLSPQMAWGRKTHLKKWGVLYKSYRLPCIYIYIFKS